MSEQQTKKSLLNEVVQHVDIKKINSAEIVDAMRSMSFASREAARAADILQMMIKDASCSNILTLAGSTSAGGCMQVYVDMVECNMVDAVVATGASVIDMDFFEALGYRHYRGTQHADDATLRSLYIDRIYDTYIDEEELQACDAAIKAIADTLEPRPYSSREFIGEMGKWLAKNAKKKESLIQTCYEKNAPVFVPAFSDCSAGFGLVMHQAERIKQGLPYVTIDSVADFRELTDVKIAAKVTGLFMVGGGAPKNFAQDTVVCAECLGKDVPMHKYAVQITVADARDGACSGSTLKEASSWGKVDTAYEQMVYAEATTVAPLIVSYAYHKGDWKKRAPKNYAALFVAK
jgi:deoxyhypusine synthase